MDGWQAVQNWTIFGIVAGGLVYYYYPKDKQVQKLVPQVEEVKKEAKKAIRKPVAAAKKAAPSVVVQDTQKSDSSSKENSSKKRKVNTQKSTPAPAPAAQQEDEDDEIDMSTRQFAANMRKAREGVDMKKADNKETRVKTVKAKSMASPILSSGSSQVGDAEDDWSPAGRAGAVDDMLEPAAPGPKALRITPSSKPTKEKVNKPAKQEVVETKKQRQNRRKKEAEKEARQEAERIRKVEAEQQLRTARIARGEPAKNGIPVPAAPAKNHWSEQNGAGQQSAGASSGSNTALLDTFDAESTASSNAGVSTAATSTTDVDGHQSEENDYAKAITQSGQDSGWNEVKTKQKSKKRDSDSEVNGNTTPVPAPVVKAAPVVNKIAPGSKPKGFQALTDEYEQRSNVADPNDASNWDA
jgi:hypothetical protein